MKKILALLFTVLACLSLFSVSAFAVSGNTSVAAAVTVGNEELTGHLPDKTAERRYKFENKTKGDVVVFLKNTDGIADKPRGSLCVVVEIFLKMPVANLQLPKSLGSSVPLIL